MRLVQKSVRDASRGFTLTEGVVVAFILLVLASVFLPALARPKRVSSRVNCANNLKQLGLACKVWSGDNYDLLPFEVPAEQNGTMEYSNTPQAFRHFAAMANELGNSPKVVSCPADTRIPAADFQTNFANANLSYFINLNAKMDSPTVLCGDRNIWPQPNCLVVVSNQFLTWGTNMHNKAGYVVYGDGSANSIPKGFNATNEHLAIP